jgi:hypothetical protein
VLGDAPVKYPDGTDARLGDRVRFSNGDEGVIVFSIDTDEYTAAFPKAEWAYLARGVMVRTDQGALVHYEDPNVNVVSLLERAKHT